MRFASRAKHEQAGILRVGDMVTWRMTEASPIWVGQLPMRVMQIELVRPGETQGQPVDEIPWSQKDQIVVDLDNGHWAYGFQISPA